MNVLVLPVGSHGDVHPLLGIAVALRDRGHRVSVAVNGHFESLVRSAGGIEYIPIGTDAEFREAIREPDLWHPVRGFQTVMRRGVLPFVPRMYEVIRSGFDAADTVLVAAALAFGARVAQEQHGYRLATTQLQPAPMRTVHDHPRLPGMFMPRGTPAFLKRWMWNVADVAVIDRVLKRPLNEFRATLGLEPIRRGVMDEWWYSPELILGLFPEWFAPPQPDWPVQTRLVGFPMFDERGVEPLHPGLVRFLDEGERPVAFTPGSANTHGREFFEASAEACRMLGRRGVLLTRHAEQVPPALPSGVIHVRYAPFSQLLPRCAALVHHGGIGTTAQALAAACPQLIMPLAHDQPDNAERVRRLGVGDEVSERRYRAAVVAGKLRELTTSPAVAASCRSVAARFEGVDPLGAACTAIEQLAPG